MIMLNGNADSSALGMLTLILSDTVYASDLSTVKALWPGKSLPIPTRGNRKFKLPMQTKLIWS